MWRPVQRRRVARGQARSTQHQCTGWIRNTRVTSRRTDVADGEIARRHVADVWRTTDAGARPLRVAGSQLRDDT